MPVNPLLAVLFTNQDKDGIYYPLFGRENGKAYGKIKDQLKGKKPNKPELHTPEEIKLMLAALTDTLKGNKRFQQIRPVYHKGGQIHSLNEKGEVVTAKGRHLGRPWRGLQYQPQRGPGHPGPGRERLRRLPLRSGPHVQGADGHRYVRPRRQARFTPVPGRLIGCAPWAFTVNQIHQLYLTPYVSWVILLLVFVLVLHYTGQGPKVADFYDAPAGNPRFSLAERWTHLIRMVTFLLLFFTGYIFFYNNVTMLKMFFGSAGSAVIFHWVAGLIFVGASLVSFILWY